MEEESLESVLHHALLALLDVKPKDPVHFLATHFQRECEKSNRVAQAAYLLENMAIPHPAVEERLLKAYATISQYRVQQEVHGLTGDIYTDLLVQLTTGLSNQHREKLLQKLQCQSTEYISFPVFRSGVLTCLLLNEFVQEVKLLFGKLCTDDSAIAIKMLCETTLKQLSKCLSRTANDPSQVLEVGTSLGICELSTILRVDMLKSSPIKEGMKSDVFLSEAVNIFLDQIPQIK